MSTVFSGGKVLQSEYWQLHRLLKKILLAEFSQFLNNISKKPVSEWESAVRNETFKFEMQLIPLGDYFYLRFLSQGYFIENNIDHWQKRYEFPESLQIIGFHTGGESESDVDERYGEGTVALIEGDIDGMIRSGEYFIATLVDHDVLWKELWKIRRQG